MPVAYHQPLSILITSILVELDVVDYLVFDRGLQQLACSFLQQLFEKRLLFIFCSLLERDHFILWHWCILSFWRPRARPPLVLFSLKGCAFLYLLIHNFRLYLGFSQASVPIHPGSGARSREHPVTGWPARL